MELVELNLKKLKKKKIT